MDPKITEMSQVFERFKAAFVRKDFNSCEKLLSQLKVSLTAFRSLPPLFEETPNAVHELSLAIVLSVKIEDQDAFGRDFFQLKPYYTDARDEIAGCSEKAYDSLSKNDALKMLLFTSEKKLLEYMKEEHPEWEIKDGSIYFQRAKDITPCKEIPSLQLINQTLSYARELERIV